MTYLGLISEVGNQLLVNMYLHDDITMQELANNIGSSRAKMVDEYKKSINITAGIRKE